MNEEERMCNHSMDDDEEEKKEFDAIVADKKRNCNLYNNYIKLYFN